MTEFSNELSADKKEKIKKNILFIAIFSITMFFAGLMSAYVVKMADGFWLHSTLPQSFWISTALILLSSATIYLALHFAMKDNKPQIKRQLTLTLIFGLGFFYFQYNGWKELYQTGNSFISPTLNHDGQYGRTYSLRYNADEVFFDGKNFKINGENVSNEIDEKITAFGKHLYEASINNDFTKIDTQSFIVVDKITGNHINDFASLSIVTKKDIAAFALTVHKKVGLFYVKGDYGKDFYLTFNSQKVEFDNGTFSIDGVPFDSNQEQMLMEHQNVNSTFLYLFSFAHLLHLAGGLIYLIRLTSKSYRGVYGKGNYLQIKLVGIYWHYLDLLWLILFLFLQFIH
ncbi:MAG: hypothetical protein ACLGGV_08845 [Bacteroidia bacterium]